MTLRLARTAPVLALASALGLVLLAPPSHAGGGARHVAAWPPTRYRSAELILWLDDPALSASVRIVGRDLDTTVDLAGGQALRIPLPPAAQCLPGVDACAIIAERVAGSGRFCLALQSPDTAGAADTLLLTAHDTVLLPPVEAASLSHVILALPNPSPTAFGESASFASVVPTSWPARVSVSASCVSVSDVLLADSEVLSVTCRVPGEDLSGGSVDADVAHVVLSGNVVTRVPWATDPGLSGDLALDLSPARRSGPTSLVVPPLPRLAALAGRGDIVRIVALEPANVSVIDAAGSTPRLLAAGEILDLDSAGAGLDRVLRIESDGALAAWQIPKSRAERGMGDPAAIPIIPRGAFTRRARFFVPDGYAEANTLVVVAEPGANPRLDGVAVGGMTLAPGGGLEYIVLALAPPAAGSGSVHELTGDAPLGAWVVGFGGYKAHGMAAALEWPVPAPRTGILRGLRPNALAQVATCDGRSWTDVNAAADAIVYYAVADDAAIVHASACAGSVCLGW